MRGSRPRRAIAVLFMSAAAGSAFDASSEAERLIESGHWKKARAIVEADQRAHPDKALNYYLLSQIRYAFGDRESPLRLAEKALELDRSVAKYHRQLAEVTGVMAQHANAFRLMLLARRFRKEIDAAITLDPKDPLALRDLMEYYLAAPGIVGGDERKALELSKRIADVDAVEGWLARERLARHRKDAAQAAKIIEEAALAVPASYRLKIAAAEAFLSAPRRDLARAEHYAREALVLDPGRHEAYAALARVHVGRAQWQELEVTLSAAEGAVPDDLTPCYRAAEALLESGANLPLAERLVRKYLGAEPEGNAPGLADARWKLRLVLEKQGKTFAKAPN